MSTLTEVEAQRRIEWLAEASPEDLIKQYRSALARIEKSVPLSDEYFEHSTHQTLVERELLKRMGA